MTDPVLHSADPEPLSTGIPEGVRVCVIGDVHGRSTEFRELLEHLVKGAGDHDRNLLIQLGDLVDRGPDSLGALDIATDVVDDPQRWGFDEVVPLMGNHEQMLRLALEGLPDFDPWIWLHNGGVDVLDELRLRAPPDIFRRLGGSRRESVPLQDQINREFGENLVALLGERRVKHLEQLQPHIRMGRLLFVHGGVDPEIETEEFLSIPWHELTEHHWAWMRYRFLKHPEPVKDHVVVHGHTPVRFGKPSESVEEIIGPHLLEGGKINLDGGSFASGCVVAAEFTATDYKITVAAGQKDRR